MNTIAKTGTILVAIDGSRNAMLAAGVGARMARLLDAHIGLIHVLEVPTAGFWGGVEARMKDDIRTQAERRLTDITEKMSSVCNIVPELYFVEGLPEEEIPRIAGEAEDVLMVIVGQHGVATEKHSHLKLRRGGSRLTGRLSELLNVPLLVVPENVPMSHICPAMAEMYDTNASQS
jgi:nucleotide-binding universal stress UspA family protein